jgi:hypothetical protein
VGVSKEVTGLVGRWSVQRCSPEQGRVGPRSWQEEGGVLELLCSQGVERVVYGVGNVYA